MVRATASLALWALAALLLTLTDQFAALFVPLPPRGTLWAQALAVTYLAALLLALLQTARAAAHLPRSRPFLLLAGVAVAAPYLTVLYLRNLAPPWLLLTANSLFLPVAAALVGAALGRTLRHPNTLLAAAGFAFFFDIVMVTMGTVAVLLKKSPQTIASASVGGGIPAPQGRPLPPPISLVTIGPADVLFMAVFLAAVVLLALSERATVWWMYGLLALALAIVQITGLPVPALAPMGVAVLIANARHAQFTRQEKVALIYGGGFALLLAAGMVAGARVLLGR